MPTIQITSNNYNGQVAQITYYSLAAPNTPINLGVHTVPYTREGSEVYGTYELNFTQYNKTCVVSITGPSTTTTTTTTTLSPGVSGYIVSGAGDTVYNGTYCHAGTVDGKPYYAHSSNPVFLFWDSDYELWALDSDTQFTGRPPGYYISENTSTPPLSQWDVGTNPPAPTLVPTTCSTTTTTTTTAAPTTTTTTTAAPSVSFTASGAGPNFSNIDGCYSVVQDTTRNGVNVYNNGTYYAWVQMVAGLFPEYEIRWYITAVLPAPGDYLPEPPHYIATDFSNDPPSVNAIPPNFWSSPRGENTPLTITSGCNANS